MGSSVVGQVHKWKYVVATGTTPHFMRVHLLRTGVDGYVPLEDADLAVRSGGSECYGVVPGTQMMKYPNAHSDTAGVINENWVLEMGDAFQAYAYVETVDRRDGFLPMNQLRGQVECQWGE
jgi:hypothetical protein